LENKMQTVPLVIAPTDIQTDEVDAYVNQGGSSAPPVPPRPVPGEPGEDVASRRNPLLRPLPRPPEQRPENTLKHAEELVGKMFKTPAGPSVIAPTDIQTDAVDANVNRGGSSAPPVPQTPLHLRSSLGGGGANPFVRPRSRDYQRGHQKVSGLVSDLFNPPAGGACVPAVQGEGTHGASASPSAHSTELKIGKYRMCELFASSARSDVFKCFDSQNSPFAIKKIRDAKLGMERARHVREVFNDITSKDYGDFFVRLVNSSDEAAGTADAFIVTEMASGSSVKQYIECFNWNSVDERNWAAKYNLYSIA